MEAFFVGVAPLETFLATDVTRLFIDAALLLIACLNDDIRGFREPVPLEEESRELEPRLAVPRLEVRLLDSDEESFCFAGADLLRGRLLTEERAEFAERDDADLLETFGAPVASCRPKIVTAAINVNAIRFRLEAFVMVIGPSPHSGLRRARDLACYFPSSTRVHLSRLRYQQTPLRRSIRNTAIESEVVRTAWTS